MTNQHTPGPWVAEMPTEGMSYYQPARVVAPNGCGDGCPCEVAGAVMPEDARLIAAAPELAEALAACLPDLKHYAATHGPGPDRRLEAALSALAKAGLL